MAMPVPQAYARMPHIENPNDYRKGGFHVIHLGDRISKYTIIDKLGFGDSSTVWLASANVEEDSCVAIAITTAETSEEAEARAKSRWWRLNDGDPNHPGRANILVPEELFTIDGPSGTHLCIVTAVQGQSISAATRRAQSDSRPLPISLVKRVVLDMISGLQYSHAMNLAHTDLHTANVLLGLPHGTGDSVKRITKLIGDPITRPFPGAAADWTSEPHPNPSQPRYLVEGISRCDINLEHRFEPVRIADWAECFFPQDAPHYIDNMGAYLCPEFNSPGKITVSMDVWQLGCGIFQMTTGHDLFGVIRDPPHKVLNSMMRILGAPPTQLFDDWISYFGGSRDKLHITQEPSVSLEQIIRAELGEGRENASLSEGEVDLFCSLIMSMIVYDPSLRPTIQEVSQHPAIDIFRSSL